MQVVSITTRRQQWLRKRSTVGGRPSRIERQRGEGVAVLSQSLLGLRAAMSLALPARQCYQSCKSTDTLPKD